MVSERILRDPNCFADSRIKELSMGRGKKKREREDAMLHPTMKRVLKDANNGE